MRAGLALRQKWAQEAERARRAADPALAAQDAAERVAMCARVRAHQRYGQLIKAAVARGELTHEQAFARIFDAEERGRELLERRRRRIFGPL
jgi:hypothetical protein